MQPLLLSASPAAGNARLGHLRGSLPSLVSKTLLSGDLDLQKSIINVQKTLHGHQNNGREILATVDNLKRLCIDHYFEEEIQSAMGGACMDLVHRDDLFDATLAFRLMREAGHEISADDVLRRFTDHTGDFKLALSKDIRGLLSLHDMSHLDMVEEASLYKAKEFSCKHLASAIRYLETTPTTSVTCRAWQKGKALLQWRSWQLQSSVLTKCSIRNKWKRLKDGGWA
ncbi:unnamed protein product [Urochloa humidicola]